MLQVIKYKKLQKIKILSHLVTFGQMSLWFQVWADC